ncbi:MAG: hypothetical protein ACI841_003948 [Planctomycetota bacterium]
MLKQWRPLGRLARVIREAVDIDGSPESSLVRGKMRREWPPGQCADTGARLREGDRPVRI